MTTHSMKKYIYGITITDTRTTFAQVLTWRLHGCFIDASQKIEIDTQVSRLNV